MVSMAQTETQVGTQTGTQPGTQRGPYAKTKFQREKILRAALDYFGQYGYWGSTMRDIARNVGLSQAGLLHHFGTKTELLTAVLEERDRETEERAHIGDERPDSALDGIAMIVVMNETQPNIVRLFTTLSAEATSEEHPAHQYFRDRYVRVSAVIADRLHAGATSGEIAPLDDYDAAARITLAAMFGLQVQWLLDPNVDMVGLFRWHLHSTYAAPTLRRSTRT
jgi:AcrR family transcriptional regulator